MYEKIVQVWRSEKLDEELQPLDPLFYTDLRRYLAELEEDLQNPNLTPLNQRIITEEIHTAKKLAQEIVDIRLQKMIHSIQRGTTLRPDHKTEEDLKIIVDLNDITNLTTRLKDFSSPATMSPQQSEKERVVLRMLQSLQKIVCVDMKTYGPFEIEDVVSLPKENAGILIERGLAVKVETQT